MSRAFRFRPEIVDPAELPRGPRGPRGPDGPGYVGGFPARVVECLRSPTGRHVLRQIANGPRHASKCRYCGHDCSERGGGRDG